MIKTLTYSYWSSIAADDFFFFFFFFFFWTIDWLISESRDFIPMKNRKKKLYIWLPSYITKAYLYNVDLLKPHFNIVKLGFTGVYNIFLISAPNVDCGYSLEPPRRGGSNEYP